VVDALRSGDLCFVQWSSWGEQLAIIARVERDWLVVHKWRARSKSWTGRVRIRPAEVISTVVYPAPRVLFAVEQLGPQLMLAAPALRLRQAVTR